MGKGQSRDSTGGGNTYNYHYQPEAFSGGSAEDLVAISESGAGSSFLSNLGQKQLAKETTEQMAMQLEAQRLAARATAPGGIGNAPFGFRRWYDSRQARKKKDITPAEKAVLRQSEAVERKVARGDRASPHEMYILQKAAKIMSRSSQKVNRPKLLRFWKVGKGENADVAGIGNAPLGLPYDLPEFKGSLADYLEDEAVEGAEPYVHRLRSGERRGRSRDMPGSYGFATQMMSNMSPGEARDMNFRRNEVHSVATGEDVGGIGNSPLALIQMMPAIAQIGGMGAQLMGGLIGSIGSKVGGKAGQGIATAGQVMGSLGQIGGGLGGMLGGGGDGGAGVASGVGNLVGAFGGGGVPPPTMLNPAVVEAEASRNPTQIVESVQENANVDLMRAKEGFRKAQLAKTQREAEAYDAASQELLVSSGNLYNMAKGVAAENGIPPPPIPTGTLQSPLDSSTRGRVPDAYGNAAFQMREYGFQPSASPNLSAEYLASRGYTVGNFPGGGFSVATENYEPRGENVAEERGYPPGFNLGGERMVSALGNQRYLMSNDPSYSDEGRITRPIIQQASPTAGVAPGTSATVGQDPPGYLNPPRGIAKGAQVDPSGLGIPRIEKDTIPREAAAEARMYYSLARWSRAAANTIRTDPERSDKFFTEADEYDKAGGAVIQSARRGTTEFGLGRAGQPNAGDSYSGPRWNAFLKSRLRELQNIVSGSDIKGSDPNQLSQLDLLRPTSLYSPAQQDLMLKARGPQFGSSSIDRTPGVEDIPRELAVHDLLSNIAVNPDRTTLFGTNSLGPTNHPTETAPFGATSVVPRKTFTEWQLERMKRLSQPYL